MYIRKSVHSIESVRDAVSETMFNPKTTYVMFDGDEIKSTSQRYQVFFTKGLRCVACGIEGKFFAKEKGHGSSQDRYHLNLYAINENDEEVLMTKDHIIPKSLGGKNTLDNLQPMCQFCNSRKGSSQIPNRL